MSDLKEVFPYYKGIGNDDNNYTIDDNYYQIKQKIKNEIKKQSLDKKEDKEDIYSRGNNLYSNYQIREKFNIEQDKCIDLDEHIQTCFSCYKKIHQLHPLERTNYFLSFIILILLIILIFKK